MMFDNEMHVATNYLREGNWDLAWPTVKKWAEGNGGYERYSNRFRYAEGAAKSGDPITACNIVAATILYICDDSENK